MVQKFLRILFITGCITDLICTNGFASSEITCGTEKRLWLTLGQLHSELKALPGYGTTDTDVGWSSTKVVYTGTYRDTGRYASQVYPTFWREVGGHAASEGPTRWKTVAVTLDKSDWPKLAVRINEGPRSGTSNDSGELKDANLFLERALKAYDEILDYRKLKSDYPGRLSPSLNSDDARKAYDGGDFAARLAKFK